MIKRRELEDPNSCLKPPADASRKSHFEYRAPTLHEYIERLVAFTREHPESEHMEIVFHDADGCAYFGVDIGMDGTCDDDTDVVRISRLFGIECV